MKKRQADKQGNRPHGFNKYRHFSAFPLMLIALGVILLLENFNLMDNALGKLWPLLIIIWGLTLIMNAIMDRM